MPLLGDKRIAPFTRHACDIILRYGLMFLICLVNLTSQWMWFTDIWELKSWIHHPYLHWDPQNPIFTFWYTTKVKDSHILLYWLLTIYHQHTYKSYTSNKSTSVLKMGNIRRMMATKMWYGTPLWIQPQPFIYICIPFIFTQIISFATFTDFVSLSQQKAT